MTCKHRWEAPSLRQLLLPVFCVVFLLFLGKHLTSAPLPEDLLQRKELLKISLSVTAALLVVGCLYSYLY